MRTGRTVGGVVCQVCAGLDVDDLDRGRERPSVGCDSGFDVEAAKESESVDGMAVDGEGTYLSTLPLPP